MDATTGVEGFQALHQRWGHLGESPLAVHIRKLIAQPAVAINLEGIEIPGTSCGLQGHARLGANCG